MHWNGVKVQILARESFCFDGQQPPSLAGVDLLTEGSNTVLAILRIMSGKSAKYILALSEFAQRHI